MTNNHFYIKPRKGELVNIPIPVSASESAVIHGVVTDETGQPIAGVLVLLFSAAQTDEQGPSAPIAHMLSDTDGHFAFSGIHGDRLYEIRTFVQNTAIRTLEVKL